MYNKVDTNMNFVEREKEDRAVLEREQYLQKIYGKQKRRRDIHIL